MRLKGFWRGKATGSFAWVKLADNSVQQVFVMAWTPSRGFLSRPLTGGELDAVIRPFGARN